MVYFIEEEKTTDENLSSNKFTPEMTLPFKSANNSSILNVISRHSNCSLSIQLKFTQSMSTKLRCKTKFGKQILTK